LVDVLALPPRPVEVHLKFDEAEMNEIWNYLPTDLQAAMNEGKELQAESPVVSVEEDGKVSLSIRIAVEDEG
jgi:predicted RNA-binding protein with RPS1 domain